MTNLLPRGATSESGYFKSTRMKMAAPRYRPCLKKRRESSCAHCLLCAGFGMGYPFKVSKRFGRSCFQVDMLINEVEPPKKGSYSRLLEHFALTNLMLCPTSKRVGTPYL